MCYWSPKSTIFPVVLLTLFNPCEFEWIFCSFVVLYHYWVSLRRNAMFVWFEGYHSPLTYFYFYFIILASYPSSIVMGLNIEWLIILRMFQGGGWSSSCICSLAMDQLLSSCDCITSAVHVAKVLTSYCRTLLAPYYSRGGGGRHLLACPWGRWVMVGLSVHCSMCSTFEKRRY